MNCVQHDSSLTLRPSTPGQEHVNPYLVLKIRRASIMEDTLQKLASVPPSGYRKALKIVFDGEPGVDEGGVQKEFFQVGRRGRVE